VWLLACLAILIVVLSLQSIVRAINSSATLSLVMAFVCTIGAYVAYGALVRWGERRRATELALRFLPGELAAGVAVGSAAMFLVVVPLWLAGYYSLEAGSWTDWAHDIREALGTGFLEELLARLVVFRLLSRALGVAWACALSAALFGAAHLGNDHATAFSALAIAVEAGLMLAGFYILTGRIWMSVGAHAGWNFVQGAIFGARVSGLDSAGSLFVSTPANGSPDLVTGGAFGPEASLSAIGIGLAVFACTLALTKRRSATVAAHVTDEDGRANA
jgi:uncharacterized protein